MNAMILAAGRGTRLGALGESTPKILVELDGEPLLARQLRYLRTGGIERVVINLHHLADQVESFLTADPQAGDVELVLEPRLLGTAGGVRNALALLGSTFVVLYGDVVVDEPLQRLLSTHERAGGLATLSVYASDQVEGKGTVQLAEDNTVTAFREKLAAHPSGEAYINAGLYVLERELVTPLPAGEPLDFGHDVFPDALAAGATLSAHILPEPVIDIGTPGALDLARARVKRS